LKDLNTDQIICFPHKKAIYKVKAPRVTENGKYQWTKWKAVETNTLFRVIWPKVARPCVRFSFIIGGQNEETEQGTNEVFKFDHNKKSLEQVASMKHVRFAFGVASFGKYIYSIGGASNSIVPCDSCERYDWKANTWEPIAKLPSKRYAMSC
jgi:hypothetical protein